MRYDARSANAIEATGLIKRFGKTTALARVDLVAREGRVLGVLGPNGAGKTTAVRILATLLRPDGGQARVCGYDVLRNAYQVRQLIGLTGQYASMDEGPFGTNNLIMIGRLLGLPRAQARARAAELLARFALTDAAADGVTVLLTTQYLDEADQLAHDIVVIDRGQVIATGTPDELKARTGGQVLLVAPSDPARLGEVATLLEALAGAEVVTDAGTDVVSAPVADKALLPRVVRELDDRGIELAEFTLCKPSLDEVFFTLTGHRTEDADTPTRELEDTSR
ncbi:MAG TPA: ATP-binding cassette domain-containing protein [Streptosporangiaceae bacterium]|nr:ATP-binding cassette domain-containing protein [Streptosporangiaceae bacterium]